MAQAYGKTIHSIKGYQDLNARIEQDSNPLGHIVDSSTSGPRNRAVQRQVVQRVLNTLQANSDASKDVHGIAQRGLRTGGSSYPFLDQIQRSFGGHDISNTSAHEGATAQRSCAELGARAYASGTDVAFGSTPDLHTAAHEAAHVVQQKEGVSLKGGVGKAGDNYERHADAVADLVVQGKSAEGLLNRVAGSASASGQSHVQGRFIQMFKEDEVCMPEPENYDPDRGMCMEPEEEKAPAESEEPGVTEYPDGICDENGCRYKEPEFCPAPPEKDEVDKGRSYPVVDPRQQYTIPQKRRATISAHRTGDIGIRGPSEEDERGMGPADLYNQDRSIEKAAAEYKRRYDKWKQEHSDASDALKEALKLLKQAKKRGKGRTPSGEASDAVIKHLEKVERTRIQLRKIESRSPQPPNLRVMPRVIRHRRQGRRARR